MKTYIYRTQVYFADTDAGGVVYYANYLKYAEAARAEMLREAGVSSSALRTECGILIVVKRCEIDYKRPAVLDDSLRLETKILEIGNSSMTLDQSVWRGDDAICAMTITLVCVGAETLRPTRWPAVMYEKFVTTA